MQLIIATSPGGSQDTIIGPFLPVLQKQLGTKINVQYRPGAGLAVGLALAHRATPDCNTLVGIVTPQIQFSYLTQKNVDYTYDDFRSLGGLAVDPAILVVRKDSPWKTLAEFIDYAKRHPGKVKVGISQYTSNYYPSLVELEERTGARFNIVSYDGGGPARKALLAGEVDASENGIYNGASIRSRTTTLALSWDRNNWAKQIGDVPTFSKALGGSFPVNESFTTLGVPAGCAKENPERFKKLQDAFAAARSSTAYHTVLKKSDSLGQLQTDSPSAFDNKVDASIPQLKSVIAKYPELQPK
ncbi:tripartite tricarboxylate transporter substrate binding protein [Streptomyces sp. NPDC050560]|uniref:tripartite tricarboxylate transporter substrate binding protein n=1 Tax=Streptomyces sp. NPDC050560 TaxID=3365630 RepID=UPI003794E454